MQNAECGIKTRNHQSAIYTPKSAFDMTQVIACFTREGIALATDSRATWFDQTGEMRHFNLKKLLRLGSHSAMISAGAGIGVEMGLAFQQFLQRQGEEDIDQIVRPALPFFTEQYGKWLSRREIKHPPFQTEPEAPLPFTGVYFILAGYSFRDRTQPFHLHLLGSGEDGISIKIYPTSHIILIPRSLSMERRLEAQCEGGSSLNQLLSLCKSFLRKRSAEEEEIGPPFHFATITPVGFKEIMDKEVEG
jgi:20S proteasome alpha/beta subunit